MLFAQVLVGASVALIMVPVLPQMQVYSARVFKVTDKEALVNRVTGKLSAPKSGAHIDFV